MGKLNKIVSISMVMTILVALGMLGYIIVTPKQSEKFTEFYILNNEGRAENYQKQVIAGKPVTIMIVIVNNEFELMSYRVDITIDNTNYDEILIGKLSHGQQLQKIVTFNIDKAGNNRKVEFWLYKNGESDPYFKDPLCLFFDVIEPL